MVEYRCEKQISEHSRLAAPQCVLVWLLVYSYSQASGLSSCFSFHADKVQIVDVVSHKIEHFRAVKKRKTPFTKKVRINCRYKQTLLLTLPWLLKRWIALSTEVITT